MTADAFLDQAAAIGVFTLVMAALATASGVIDTVSRLVRRRRLRRYAADLRRQAAARPRWPRWIRKPPEVTVTRYAAGEPFNDEPPTAPSPLEVTTPRRLPDWLDGIR